MSQTSPITRRIATEDDLGHLDAIDLRISNYKARLANAKRPNDRAFFEREVASAERERENEIKFLANQGIDMPAPMTIDEIMAELDILDS